MAGFVNTLITIIITYPCYSSGVPRIDFNLTNRALKCSPSLPALLIYKILRQLARPTFFSKSTYPFYMRSDFGNLLRSSKFSTTTPVVCQCDLKEALTPSTSSYFCLSTALRSLSSLLLILLAACLLGSLAKFRPLWRAMRILRLGILRPAN